MAFFDNSSWAAPGRQPSWEQQPQPPSRSGTESVGAREEPNSFVSQFTEVDRAIDNLVKSGKMPFSAAGGVRRESLPMGRQLSDFEGQRIPNVQRHHSVSEFDGMRPQSGGNLQNFYANQRYGPRPTEQDQAMQAKRRMAAQRERELRNYHQEQQYHKHVAGPKSDRSMSPNAGMTEEERRELIARQHRALYGNDSTLYPEQGSRPSSQDARVGSQGRGGVNSPLAFDHYGQQGQNNSGEPAVQMPSREHGNNPGNDGTQRERANSNSSPASNPTTNFSLFDNAQQSSRTSTSSPGGSPPRQGNNKTSSAGVAPIGTRPTAGQSATQGLQKRSTTPLPSPLSYGFSANDQSNNERSTSASSNPSSSVADKGVGLGWGSNSGVWSNNKNSLGVQASVWG